MADDRDVAERQGVEQREQVTCDVARSVGDRKHLRLAVTRRTDDDRPSKAGEVVDDGAPRHRTVDPRPGTVDQEERRTRPELGVVRPHAVDRHDVIAGT